jgi:DNA-binding response OmpR family regulator
MLMQKPVLLVVDDDADFARILTTRFENDGFEVHWAADGETGLASARAVRPDAIILDLLLPKLNGFEVCERLKADEATRLIPVIMLTGAYLSDADVQQGMRVGAQDYVFKADLVLAKPQPVTDLLSRVRDLMAGPQSAEERQPTALAIDDDPVTLRLLQYVLGRQGFDVTTRSDPAQALAELDVAAYDLILLDFMMPGMDGIEALKAIRRVTEDAAVVIVTGHGSEEVAQEAIRHDADDYVVKPLDVDQISRVAARNLAKARLRQERVQLMAQLRESTLQWARNCERAEQRNAELNEALAKLEETQAQLVEAQRLAAVMQTAITVNHEINNPLAAIVGNVHFLMTDGSVTSPEALQRLKVIKEQCARIQDTTTRLARVTQTVTTEYTRGVPMLDLEASAPPPANGPAPQGPAEGPESACRH